ncbi:hypothetical protein C2857_000370, partial [Epichloe festucae Fl1]
MSRSVLPSAKALPAAEDCESVRDGQLDQRAPHLYPLTAHQVEDTIRQFIESIDKAAACDLASRFNDGRPCKVVDQKNGSFNICFFILFDAENVTWVLRIPIAPVVIDAWTKVVSEVTTIRYIKRKTTIPVPQIYAYGKDTTLVEGTSTPFMLLEFMHGQQLHTRTFFDATEHQRRNLYIGLINILAQLRKLEFPAIGSLMPNPDNPDDELNPRTGTFLSLTINEFERQRQQPLSMETSTVKQLIDLHCHMLSETFQMPTEELEPRQAKSEMFALHSVTRKIQDCIDLEESNHSFVLAHPDLRCGNIIVDDNFNILGVIDWEYTSTVPQQLFVPPPWITGHDPDTLLLVTGVPRCQVLQEFGTVLQEMHETSSGWTQLWQDWGFQRENIAPSKELLLELSPIVQILRHPASLPDVYYSSIFKQSFGSDADKDVVVNNFFQDNPTFAERIELQLQNSERYTEYLKNHDLLIPDERLQFMKEWLEKANALLQAGRARRG